jgi:hypothetical protein
LTVFTPDGKACAALARAREGKLLAADSAASSLKKRRLVTSNPMKCPQSMKHR